MLLTALPLAAQDNVIDEVLWVVGDEAILKSDVEQARLYYMMQGKSIEGEPYCVIPEQLAIQKLFLHQAAIDSIEVTEQEVLNAVEQEINGRITQIGSREKMEEYFGKSSTQLREELRETMRDRMIMERTQYALFENVTVTPAEVRRGYAQMKEEDIPGRAVSSAGRVAVSASGAASGGFGHRCMGGSVVEFSPATREARVRFPANAACSFLSGYPHFNFFFCFFL